MNTNNPSILLWHIFMAQQILWSNSNTHQMRYDAMRCDAMPYQAIHSMPYDGISSIKSFFFFFLLYLHSCFYFFISLYFLFVFVKNGKIFCNLFWFVIFLLMIFNIFTSCRHVCCCVRILLLEILRISTDFLIKLMEGFKGNKITTNLSSCKQL